MSVCLYPLRNVAGPSRLRPRVKSKTLYGLCSSPTYTHILACLVFSGHSIGITVSSVQMTWLLSTRRTIRSYSGCSKSATSPHQTLWVARLISNPLRWKMFSSRYKGR